MHSCSGKVWPPGAFRPSGCMKGATVERGGIWFCKIHDPEAVAARRQKSDERIAANMAVNDRRWRRERLAKEIAELARKLIRQQATMEEMELLVAQYEATIDAP